MSSKLPTILDNQPHHSVKDTLGRILNQTKAFDVATGYFEIGALLGLDGVWQNLEQLRILMGDEMTKRTRTELVQAACSQSDLSIEEAKEEDDFLLGLPAIREAIKSKQIVPKVYTKAKFHAKLYLMHTDVQSLSNYAVVGSSNFTAPGLTQNIELNLLTSDQHQFDALSAWYEKMWGQGEDVSAELLKVIDRHLVEYQPFTIWAKALYEYFSGRDKTQTEWERNESVVYPKLSKYQQDGYHRALQISDRWGGSLVCDGVGLGKTFIGLMLIEHAIYLKKKVLLIVPKSGRKSVWEKNLNRYLKPTYRRAFRDFLVIHNHTDFGREETVPQEDIDYYRDFFDVVIIDEAHHFRTPTSTRSKKLMQICSRGASGEAKQVHLLTATPINNTLVDLYNLINFFALDDYRHFQDIGISNLRLHFTAIEKVLVGKSGRSGDSIPEDVIHVASQDLLRTDKLLTEVLIQRSRKYVMDSEQLVEKRPCFPKRLPPVVVEYSLHKAYAGLFEDIVLSFGSDGPLLSLAIYKTEHYKFTDQDVMKLYAQGNVAGLIRTLLLKRLESSYMAFQGSLEDLFVKMGKFVEANAPDEWWRWRGQHDNLWLSALLHHDVKRRGSEDNDEEENDVPDLPPALDPKEFDVKSIIQHTLSDLTQIGGILTKVWSKLTPSSDDKLRSLKQLLQSPEVKGRKVLVFTEFRDTARYIASELAKIPGLPAMEQLDSDRNLDRERVIKRFAPYYNCEDTELDSYLKQPVDILISTDVLSEGLNLQDANILVNYDVHWNPVRLMQRMGRVDRRLDRDKPVCHDKVHIYNFLPPGELERLLKLLERVSGKILKINTTLGIEAPILTPDDPEAAMKLFNEGYEQEESILERLELELQRIQVDHPDLYASLPDLPRRIFSGRKVVKGRIPGVFAAFRYPPHHEGGIGELRWYFREASGTILEGIEAVADIVSCEPDYERLIGSTVDELRVALDDINKQKVRRHLRDTQAPAGSKALLICWLEVVA